MKRWAVSLDGPFGAVTAIHLRSFAGLELTTTFAYLYESAKIKSPKWDYSRVFVSAEDELDAYNRAVKFVSGQKKEILG